MPSIDLLNKSGDDSPAPSTTPIVGIIYPPPEVRNIVDKTASFVARNGPEFESRIRQNELGNPKFNFLNPGDPYHTYYQHKVKEFREGRGSDFAAPASVPGPQKPIITTREKQQEILKQIEPFIPRDPPHEYEFIADPPSISALDLEVVKLTAQFVARNGRQFLTNLMNREQRNYQFDFLRPQHSLFQYFTKLLEQYTKILIPPKDLMNKLKEESTNITGVLEQVKYRADWLKHQEAQKRREELALEKERVAYAQIDWHDFVVVETVDYVPGEIGNFPPPTTPEEVGARVLMQERMLEGIDEAEMQMASEGEDELELRNDDGNIEHISDKGAKDNIQVQDMEEGSSSDDEREPERSHPLPHSIPTHKLLLDKRVAQPPPVPPVPDKVIVKKYDPKQGMAKITKPTDEYLVSPITGTKIPASKVQEHMRISLLDPRWVEQRDKHLQDRINQESVYAPGSAIEASLKQLAERRTDIFGIGDEETAIGKKIGEEDKKKDDKVTWDGHTSSVEAATRAARANITIEEQIHQIHKVKGLLPDEEKEKIGPKPVGGSGPKVTAPVTMATASAGVTVSAPPLPPSKPPAPPMPPVAAAPPLPPPSIMAPPQPPIMMVPAPMRPPLMVPPGAFPVVAASTFITPTAAQMQQATALTLGLKTGLEGEDEPPLKKQKTEDSLIPEDQFLAQHKGPVSFKVQAPMLADKPEWRCNGQLISVTVLPTDTIANVKAKIHEVTSMPPAKQKLQLEGMFFKDNNSLAFYNIVSGAIIQLQVKERGGRKK